MVSLIKLSVAVIAVLMFMEHSGMSVHPKGMQVGPIDAFLSRDNVIKNPHPISTPKGDRLDRS